MPGKKPDLGALVRRSSAGIGGIRDGDREQPERADDDQAPRHGEADAPPPAPPEPRQRARQDRSAARPASASPAERPPAPPRPPRPTARAPEAAAGERRNKTFSLEPGLIRRTRVAAATTGVFEYAIVEAALGAFFAAHPAAGPSPLPRRSAGDTTARRNKTLTITPHLIRDVAIAAANWEVFEYAVVEAALEAHLSRLAHGQT